MILNKELSTKWLINNGYTKYQASERIDELESMNYLKIQPYDNVYKFWNNICLALINRQIIGIDEINQCGGRKSRKTYTTCQAIATIMAIAIKYDLKVAVYGFRWLGADIQELRKEMESAIERVGLKESRFKTSFGDSHYKFKSPMNKPIWEFINGSFIQLQGIHNSKNGKVAVKGLRRLSDFDLSIEFCEEANEFTNSEFEAISFAIGGAKQNIKIKNSNPDSEYQDFIKYCMERVPFNKNVLHDMGHQKEVIVENGKRKLFLYANYQVNPYLQPHEITEFTELKVLNYLQYEIWGLGMPGQLSEAVFSHYLKELDKAKDFTPIRFSAGLDLGQADSPQGHPTALEIVGIDRNNNIKVYDEYFHSNATMKHLKPDEIAREILETIIKPVKRYHELKNDMTMRYEQPDYYNDLLDKYENLYKAYLNGFILRIDYGSGGAYFIDRIKQIREQEYQEYGWLTIQPVDKSIWFIKDRVDLTINMLTSGVLKIDKDKTPQLVKQMNLMKWKVPTNDNSNHKLEIVDLNDDCWDALMYSLMFMAKQTISKITNMNSLMIGKNNRYA